MLSKCHETRAPKKPALSEPASEALRTKPDCEPPYVVDATTGKKHWTSSTTDYAGRPLPCPSSHSVQKVPIPLKQRTRAGLPHLHVSAGNILAALGAGMSWFFASNTGWPQTLQAG
jgi:hypothetical protein